MAVTVVGILLNSERSSQRTALSSRQAFKFIRSELWQLPRLGSPATRPQPLAPQSAGHPLHGFWNWMGFALPLF